MGFFPYILDGILQERSGLLPENFLLFKAFFCFISSDVSFILHLVEKEDEMGGDSYNTPLIWESVCQEVSVFAMDSPNSLSSCDEAQLWGQTGNELSFVWSVCLAFGRSRLGRSLDLTPFLSLQQAYSREHKSIQ